jgi:hypothetical protein
VRAKAAGPETDRARATAALVNRTSRRPRRILFLHALVRARITPLRA